MLFLFNGNVQNVGCHTVGDNGDRYSVKQNHVPTFTVDQLNLDQCDLIQLDCEGYEPKVIRGAINTIEKFRPVISMETTDASTEELLHKIGYIHMTTVGSDKIFAVKD
jgi:FkbM family methyltransferase